MFYGVDKINAFALAMLNQTELDDLLWSIAQGVGEIMLFEDCVIYLRNEDKLVQMAAYGSKNPKDREIFERIEIPIGKGIVGTVAETGIAEIVSDTRVDNRYINDQFEVLSELAVPVIYEGCTIAVIDSVSDKVGDYSEFEMALLQVIANIAAPRIASAQYRLELQQTQLRLERSNRELQESLAQLAHNQSVMIESEKMAALGVLSASIAHEINTPLGFAISNINTIKQDYLPDIISRFTALKNDPSVSNEIKSRVFDDELTYILDDLTELTSETVNGLNSAKQIMLDLKRFSRGDSDVHELSDINKGIESTLNILRNELKDTCKVHLTLNPLPETTVNMSKLNQVFMNLIINAKQSFDGDGEIFIVSMVKEQNIVISIRDTGCGIPQADLKDIFTPFYTTKPIGEGTGLGLAICYRIICDEHKGNLSVTSNESGSEFTITLPLAENHLLQA